ncbi:LETM1 and EF-hand domain-containing protein 1 mitochondrial-like [Trifolium medium]|uniref:LETM1 and EF-hand domain-containing protein 1 mitochondrial-like n=1 Tax=Trifolium medium TaxID=97028 RepID=A0A392M9Y3_9FABA|nr:LETM1 and EF-hand domain-containing protein 1 mitochondrial-like [Trifolium medium]
MKNDNKLIQEGVESLSEAALRQACRDRGLLGLHIVEGMRQQVKPEEAVQAILSSLPDEVVVTVCVTALPSGDSVSDKNRKLEYLECTRS